MTRRTLADVRKLSAEMGPLLVPKWPWVSRASFGYVYTAAMIDSAFDSKCEMKLLLELDRLPLVWTPEDVARVMRRPKIDIDSDDEYEIAERMTVLWAQYAQEVKR